MRTACKAAGRDRIALVSDAMPSVGATHSAFNLHGRPIVLSEGRLVAPDGTLAGAHLTMLRAVRNATALIGTSLEDALVMASATPARLLGLDKTHGRIAPDYSANLTAFTPDFASVGTWIDGQYLTALN